MKKTLKKLIALAMMLALILSMSVFASADSTTTATAAGLTMRFGDTDTTTYPLTHPEANMRFTEREDGDFNVTYVDGISNYYPDTLAFTISSGASSISSITSSGVTVQPTVRNSETDYEPTTNVQQGFYILYIETASAGTKSCTFNTSTGSVKLYFEVPTFTPSTGSKICAFLPAPGQFTNEGITTGGWGDAYDGTTSHALKGNVATGVSLGYFGGYVVFDMGAIIRGTNNAYVSGGVYNSSTTPYGTDFILYGNAFWNNSEPGCIQVSQDYTHWYDIAGSQYYQGNCVSSTIEYQNPDPANDYSITTATNNAGNKLAVPYTGTNLEGTYTSVATNNFHNHAYFPLNANYFSGRYGHAELSDADTLPFATRTLNSNGITTFLELSGKRIKTKATSELQFGYADVHPNKTLGGTVSYNPYTPNTSSSTWSTISDGTSGGDPIDISWAVNSDGTPAKLDAIRYIRVYTGVEMATPPFGEVSTEVCGISVCSGSGSGSPATPTINVAGQNKTTTNGNIQSIYDLGTSSVSFIVTGTGNIYVNGVSHSSGDTLSFNPSSTGTIVQVIVQNGTAAPYITWLRLYSISED